MSKYNILLKNGHIIDPASNINSQMDLAISGGGIRLIEKNIPPETSNKVIDASGLYITPGLIDLHAHCLGPIGIYPDELCLPFCTTTMLDVGGSGWKSFDNFKDTVINTSTTRVFALLNIVGQGMITDVEQNISNMDPDLGTTSSLEWLQSQNFGVVFSHYEKGFWIEGIANKSVVMDGLFDYSPDVEQRYNDSMTLFNSRNLKNTMTILDKYNVTYIWIDNKMKTGQVWEKENQGLLFLLKNSEKFKRVYYLNKIEIWKYIK